MTELVEGEGQSERQARIKVASEIGCSDKTLGPKRHAVKPLKRQE